MTEVSVLATLARRATESRSEDSIRTFAEHAVSIARQKQKPRMSLAAIIREHFRKDLELSAKVGKVAFLVLTADLPLAIVPDERTDNWVRLEVAARRLDVLPETLRNRLVDVEYRRLYGWPWFDGHRWLFASAALDPERRSAYLAAQPVVEPFTLMPTAKRSRRA